MSMTLPQILGVIADGLWIAALAVMAASARTARARLAPDAKIRLRPDAAAGSGPTLSPGQALYAVPVAAFFLGLILLAGRIWADANQLAAIALFAVRTMAAALVALAHIVWMGRILERAAADGALKP